MEQQGPKVPDTLTVIFADAYRAHIAYYEGQTMPYAKRSVQIKLTDEQKAALTPRVTGQVGIGAVNMYEEIVEAFLEPVEGE